MEQWTQHTVEPVRPALTARDLAILAALIAQPTRSAAAASLGWSERHFRRLVADLLQRLDVPSSHAAVAVAVRAGLIEP